MEFLKQNIKKLSLILVVFLTCVSGYSYALETVRLQLKWKHQFQFAGYYAAVKNGYYRDVGLDVEIIERTPNIASFDSVLAGNAEYGVSGSEIVAEWLAGKPVSVLAVVFQHSPAILITLAESGITNPQQLIGKKAMLGAMLVSAELKAMLIKEDVSIDKLKILRHSFDIRDLVRGHVDVMSAYSTAQPFYLDSIGVRYNIIRPATYGFDFYGDVLFTSLQEIERHPERAKKFREASLKGWGYALSHVDEMVEYIHDRYNTEKRNISKGYLAFEAEATRKIILPDLVELGHVNPDRWEKIAQTYVDLGLAKPGFSLDGFIYDPDPTPDLTEFYWIFAVVLMISGVIGTIAIVLFRLNRRLRREISERKRLEKTHESIINLHHGKDEKVMDDILKQGLEAGIQLTNSKIGYLHFINPDQETISLQIWSENTIRDCSASQVSDHYPISTAGIWVDCICQKKPVMHNNYEAVPDKKGLPDGHVPVYRDLAVPVLESGKVTAILGVGNKPVDYDTLDCTLLTLLAGNIWNIVRFKRAEEEIKASLLEKDTLLHEIHHRVKNNMQIIASLLDMQLRRKDMMDVETIVKESKGRVYAMAAIHESFYRSENLSEIDLNAYVQHLTSLLAQTFSKSPESVHFDIEIPEVGLDIDTANPLGLVLNELISNSLKYAFPDDQKGIIRIQATQQDDHCVEMVVADNGIGMSETLDWNHTKTLGLRLVKDLVERQLNGSVNYEMQNGARFTITFNPESDY